MRFLRVCVWFVLSFLSAVAAADEGLGARFDRAIFVIFENTDYEAAMAEPFFKELASKGVNFTNFEAKARPSQPNYLALTSGDTHGVRTNGNVNLDVRNIADLLDDKGISWKIYAEGYPGNCFKGASKGEYTRKHNPFISYVNIQNNPERCAKIVNADEFETDVAANALPQYVFYIPDNRNAGHDTGVAFADRWYEKKFGPLVSNANFMSRTILISTFDEADWFGRNRIYTSIVGPDVISGLSMEDLFDHYSLLKLIEDNWNLGNLGLKDAKANPINSIWKE